MSAFGLYGGCRRGGERDCWDGGGAWARVEDGISCVLKGGNLERMVALFGFEAGESFAHSGKLGENSVLVVKNSCEEGDLDGRCVVKSRRGSNVGDGVGEGGVYEVHLGDEVVQDGFELFSSFMLDESWGITH